MKGAHQPSFALDYRTRFRSIMAMAFLALLAGCGRGVEPGRTHHRLYSWSCPRAEGGQAYLVLRYQDQWADARRSTRVGLIKFRTDPEPSLYQDRWVWGVPTGEEEFVLFDAMRNRVIRRTDYVREIDLGAPGTDLLAFQQRSSGAIEIVRADGQVLISAQAGFTEAKLAFARLDGMPVLALTRADGQVELRSGDGEAVDAGPVLTTLHFDAIIRP